MVADFPRTYIDPNRSKLEVDISMINGRWPHDVHVTKKLDVGMGLIRKYILPNAPMYSKKLTVFEVENRIKNYWSPYHQSLQTLLEEKLSEFGSIFYINWHSMKSKGNQMNIDSGKKRPDFVVSDQDGETSSREFRDLITKSLMEKGYEVAINYPYKGAELIKRYGAPSKNCNAIQIEMNRRLYLDENSVSKNDGFLVLKDDKQLNEIESLISISNPNCKVLSIPAWDISPYDNSSPNKVLNGQRISTLSVSYTHLTLPTKRIV